MKRYIRSSATSSKTVNDSNVKASTDNYNPYSFMVGDQLEWSGLYGGEYKGVVTDVTDEYITVDVMWIAEDTGDTVTNTRRFEIATDPEGRECIIVYRYRDTVGYVYPPSNEYINSAEEYFDKVYGKCISEANQDINTIRRMYANNEGAPSTILLNLGYTEDESGEAFTKSMHTAGHIYETVFNFAKYDWEDGPVLMYVLRDGEVPKGWTVTKFDLYDEEGNVISSAIDPYSEEDDPAEFNSIEDYLKYNIEEGYIDWLSLPSEENDDFDDDDFYDIVYQIESAIAKVTREGGYKICVPNQFEDENGAFCAVIANGKRYAVEGRGNTWILSESDESVESCSNVKSSRKIHASWNYYPYALYSYTSGDAETGIEGDKFDIIDVVKSADEDEAKRYFKSKRMWYPNTYVDRISEDDYNAFLKEREEWGMYEAAEDDAEEADEVDIDFTDSTEDDEKNEEEDDDMQDIEIDEIQEESFNIIGNKLLQNIYENVDHFEMTKASTSSNQLKLEGLITFKSGKTKPTQFIFEAKDISKTGRLRFLGENAHISSAKKPFMITGYLKDNKYIVESLNYNFSAKRADGTPIKLQGTVSAKR